MCNFGDLLMKQNNMENEKFDRILCFGEVLWDMLPTGALPGGAPLNVAIHLKKQGKIPVLVSAIGDDEEGKRLMDYLQQSEIYTYLIQTDKTLPTSKVLVHLDENKNASYEICNPVAWDNIQMNKEVAQAAESADLIVFGSLASRNPPTRNTLFQLLEKTEATLLLDVNLRPPFSQKIVEELLQESDFIKLNDDELREISNWNSFTGTEKELASYVSNHYNCPTVCVTRGENGALLYIDGVFYEHPGFKVEVTDTVGAGDSFLAGLIVALSKKWEPEKALEYACALGAFVASKKGAVPDYSENDILYNFAIGKQI